MNVTLIGLADQVGDKCIPESEVQRHILLLKDPKTSHRDRASAEKLLLSKYYPLMVKWIKYYTEDPNDRTRPRPVNMDPEDFISAALIAFTKALQMFDPSRECKFITILQKSLMNELIGVFRIQYRQHTVEACSSSEFLVDVEEDDTDVVHSPETPEESSAVRSDMDFDLYQAEAIRNEAQLMTDESILLFLSGSLSGSQESVLNVKSQVGISLSSAQNIRMRYLTQFREQIARVVDERKPASLVPKTPEEFESVLNFEMTTAESLLIQLQLRPKPSKQKGARPRKVSKGLMLERSRVPKFLKALASEAERLSVSTLVRVTAQEYALL